MREFHAKGYSHAESVDRAVEYCIDQDILRGFLIKNRSEVYYMFDTDYSEKKFWEMKKYNYEKALKEKDEELAEKLAEKDHEVAEKLAEKDNEIAKYRDEINQLKKQLAQSDDLSEV